MSDNDTLRDTIESAFDAHETPATEHVPETPAPAPAEPQHAETEPAAARSANRDAQGRFAKATDPAPAREAREAPAPDPSRAAPVDKTNGQTPPVEAKPDPYAKAPQSWKPGAREAWAQLPPDVREEVHRRERESTRLAQEHAQARNVATYVQRLQQQFAPALQAEGVDALTASANLMNLASRLRYGNQVEKAQLAAQIVRSYGVDVVALAAALDGQNYVSPQHPQGMYQDPRVDQLLAREQERIQAYEQRKQEKAVNDVESFGEGKDFFEDVRADMGDLMELFAKRGIDLSLQEAYDRACSMNPEIARVMAAREAAKAAGNGNPSIRRAKVAASSVRGTPANGASTPPPTDLRGAIEAAIEQVGGR